VIVLSALRFWADAQFQGVALSGGPDSTALAYLLHRHATLNPESGLKTVKALIIDHGLRNGSAQEAKQVSQWARDLGESVC
jgi:tRNA(Ile)-lysidine synthase TilS/MesJ